MEKSAALNLGPGWQHNAARPPRPTSVLKFSFQYIFSFILFYNKDALLFLYSIFNLNLDFPFIITELNINFDFLFLTTKFKSIEPQ